MKRKDQEIRDIQKIELIINQASVCRIAFCDNNKPYIVPMNFGYEDKNLYLHSSKEGKKMTILKNNKNISFEMDIRTELLVSDKPCGWTMKYYSVIGFGEAVFLEAMEEKIKALNVIMNKYSGKSSFEYPVSALEEVAVIKIKIHELTGKQSGYE